MHAVHSRLRRTLRKEADPLCHTSLVERESKPKYRCPAVERESELKCCCSNRRSLHKWGNWRTKWSFMQKWSTLAAGSEAQLTERIPGTPTLKKLVVAHYMCNVSDPSVW